MSYQRPPQRALAARPRITPPALGGLLDQLLGESGAAAVREGLGITSSHQLECLDKANAKVAPLDAQIQSLASSWRPAGHFSPAAMLTTFNLVMGMISAARATVMQAPLSTNDAGSVTNMANQELDLQVQRAKVFVAAFQEAVAKGAKVIEAPTFREWVLRSMTAVSNAIVTASVLSCNMIWLVQAIALYQVYFDKVAGAARTLVDIVVAVGETIANVPADLSKLFSVAKYGAVAALGYLVYQRVKGGV